MVLKSDTSVLTHGRPASEARVAPVDYATLAGFEVEMDSDTTKVYAAAVGRSLPPSRTVRDEVADGHVDEFTARRTGITGVCVCDGTGPPADHAVRAAKVAVPESVRSGADGPFIATMHASMWFQGFDLWCSASYVQHKVLPTPCFSVDISQLSTGGMAGIELGFKQLKGHRSPARVLVTAADCFFLPGIDRWHTDPGTVLADGGAAIVLSNEAGFAEVLSVVSVFDPELEVMSRGNDQPSIQPLSTRIPASLDVGRKAVLSEYGRDFLIQRLQQGQIDAYQGALDEAGVEHADIDRQVVPHMGESKTRHQIFVPLQIDPERSTWFWGRTVGHLGAGDQLAGLSWLLESEVVSSGDLIALVGAGGGFSWSTAVLRIC